MSEPDKDYIIRIIQFLDNRHNIAFFINPKDFDALYGWWQKRIPMKVVEDSITQVVDRWQAKKKPVTSFVNFKYEVRKNFKSFLQLSVGTEGAADQPQPEEKTAASNQEQPEENPFQEYDTFLEHFPEPLNPIREAFETLFNGIKKEENPDPEELQKALVDLFSGDEQLNLKSSLFLKNLPEKMRKPEIEARYRLNYLINKFRIPALD